MQNRPGKRPWDSLHVLPMDQWDVFSDECDKDSGYEADPAHCKPRRRGKLMKEPHYSEFCFEDTRLDPRPQDPPHFNNAEVRLGFDEARMGPVEARLRFPEARGRIRRRGSYSSNYETKDELSGLTHLEKSRFSSLQRPLKRQRKPPDSILKNSATGSYNSLPRGYSLRNSVKFASPVDSEPKSFDSDQLDFLALNKNVYENHLSEREIILRDSVGIVSGVQGVRGTHNQLLVDNRNHPVNGEGGLSSINQLSSQGLGNGLTGPAAGKPGQGNGTGISNQGYASLTSATTFPIAQTGNKPSEDRGDGWLERQDSKDTGWSERNGSVSGSASLPNGNSSRKNTFSDSEHYLRKSASVQIIAHEPSRCEGCFDGRLPLLLIVIFIGVVIFFLCLGVVLDFENDASVKESSALDSSVQCQNTMCKFGATCEEEEGKFVCKCPHKCSSTIRPVCGSDDLTYDNDCLRQLAQCKLQKPVKFVQTGPCVRDPCLNLECPENQMCLPSFDLASARCVCKGPCSDSTDTVCGSDGVDYASYCHLQRDSCQMEINITKVYDGPCDPCKSMSCPSERNCIVNSDRKASCTCLADCPHVIQVVCASNGKSYRNQCTMRQDSCRLGLNLTVVHSGECDRADPCATLRCVDGAECVPDSGGTPSCVCSDCAPVYDPVCGSDNVTYQSLCHLKQESCKRSKLIELAFYGTCSRKCKSRRCPKYSSCRVDHLGESSCECVPCSLEWVPVCGASTVYDNLCQLKHAACTSNTDIRPESLDNCDQPHSEEEILHVETSKPPAAPSPVQPWTVPPTPYFRTTPRAPVYQVGDCSSSPCQGGGTCEAHDGTFTCFCGEERAGRFCDIKIEPNSMFVPRFTGVSLFEFRTPRHLEHKMTLELQFKPLYHTGILLYSHQAEDGLGDFLSISLLEGFVELRYNLGDGYLILRSMNPVLLGEWNLLIVKRWHQDGVLELNGHPQTKGRTNGFLKSLDLSSSIFIGYISSSVKQVYTNIGSSVGFNGCIRKLKINSQSFLFSDRDNLFLGQNHISDCSASVCTTNFCKNQGQCEESNGIPTCRCQNGFTGPNCEIENDLLGFLDQHCKGHPQLPECTPCSGDCRVPDFSGSSYLTIRDMGGMAQEFIIEVWVLIRQLDGCILYSGASNSGGGDFFALNIINGYLDFRFDLGSGTASIKTQRPVTLNTWHTVRIFRRGALGTLQLNSDPPVQGMSPPPMTELNLRDVIYVGGISDPKLLHPDSGVVSYLDGAIQRVIINGHLLTNLKQMSIERRGVQEYTGAPCNLHRCQNGGTCVPHFRTALCRCRPGYVGKFCNSPGK